MRGLWSAVCVPKVFAVSSSLTSGFLIDRGFSRERLRQHPKNRDEERGGRGDCVCFWLRSFFTKKTASKATKIVYQNIRAFQSPARTRS